ncbi:MAG TPA: acyl-CoA dehydrogenase family protein, partial [Steroidobacteraceae bacterium]|nr:acyl-CoA dehydrogenase family protein [Steroidobacteraceae bacterium]
MAPSGSFLDWPFFTASHRELAGRVREWAAERLAAPATAEDRDSVDSACRQLVRDLGRAGWTRYCAPAEGVHGKAGSAHVDFDVRALALIRETLARHDALADFAFGMQGLGSGAIS